MKSARILVVDDAKFTRDLMIKAVKSEYVGLEVDSAPDGRKAQILLTKNRYDLVLCDWEMPEMSGIELLTWLREQEDCRNREIPFVMVTSLGDKEYILQAAEHGVTDYVTKPFNNEQLVNKVTKHFLRQGVITREELAELMKKRTRMLGGGNTANVLTSKIGMNTGATSVGPRKVRGRAMLLVSEQQISTLIRELSPQEVVLVLKRDEVSQIPALFDGVSVGLLAGQGDNQMRYTVKGKVIFLQAQEKKVDAEALYVGIRFIELDAKAQQTLSKLIARLSS